MSRGFPKRLVPLVEEFIDRGGEFTTREITEAINKSSPHLGATMPSMTSYMGWLHRTGRVEICRYKPYDVAVYKGDKP